MDLLRDFVKILADSGVHGYSFDDAMYDYKLSLLHRFGSLISTIANMPFTEVQIREHIEVMLPRMISAMIDHDCLALLNNWL